MLITNHNIMFDTQIKQIDLQEVLDTLSDRTFAVQTGEEKALPLYADLHLLYRAIRDMKDEISTQAIDEAETYDKREKPEFNGFKVSVNSRKNWKYSDPEIDRLKALQRERQNLAKQAYQMSNKGAVMHDESGEIIEPATFTESTFIKMESA